MKPQKIYLIIIHLFALIGLFFTLAYLAIMLGFTKTSGIKDLNRNLKNTSSATITENDWVKSEEYQSFNKSIPKDADKINTAAQAVGINPRLIVSALLAEQLRLYTDSSREAFKQFFQPLSILGVQSQYSWGVMGMKKETAIQIENNLKDPSSPFYLDPSYEHLLDFKTNDTETERFNRLTDPHDQYYSYLYAGLYMKEIMTEWNNAKLSIDKRPDIIATLYNIGFIHSTPNANPISGGAPITVGGKTYSFGELANDFYYSNELLNYFPQNK